LFVAVEVGKLSYSAFGSQVVVVEEQVVSLFVWRGVFVAHKDVQVGALLSARHYKRRA
jgi:hypothetical protein